MHDLQSLQVVNVIPPAAVEKNGSWTPNLVDTRGYAEAKFLVSLGATDVAVTALKVQECDTSDGSFTDVPGADFSVPTNLQIDGSAAALPSATDDNKVWTVDINLPGRKRYLKLIATAANGSTGAYLSAVAVLARAAIAPLSLADQGVGAALRV